MKIHQPINSSIVDTAFSYFGDSGKQAASALNSNDENLKPSANFDISTQSRNSSPEELLGPIADFNPNDWGEYNHYIFQESILHVKTGGHYWNETFGSS